MRLLWCYGSERFWNFCGRTIHDRAHPLANFTKTTNTRRAVDCVPRRFVDELLSFADEHQLQSVTDAVQNAIGVPKPDVFGVRALYKNLDLSSPAAPIAPELLLSALKQLSFDWASISYETRTTS